jgi:hypothetical protein
MSPGDVAAILVDFKTLDGNASFDRGLEGLGHIALLSLAVLAG